MKKCNISMHVFENEEMQKVKKTIGGNTISERSTVVVERAGLATRAAPQPEAKNKKNVIPTQGGSNMRSEDGTTIIIYMK